MNTNTNQVTAKIYQFPVGGRRALDARHQQNARSVAEINSERAFESVVGGSWYHEAAIRETEPSRKP